MVSRLPNWSVDRYASTPKQCISTFTRHIFHSSKMSACTVTRIDVGSVVTRYGKKRLSCANTSACVRGECVESILVACTIRLHRCSNVWTTRSFVWLNRCATILIEPPLTSSVGSTRNNFRAYSDKVHWVARHVPLSVSVASNVPGHERVQCLVTDGDTNKLVSRMMDILQAMSDAAYDKIKHSYEDVLEQLAEELTNWDEREETTRAANDKKKSRRTTNPYKKLDGCVSYPSSGSIRVSMISMPSNSASYPTSYPPRQRQGNKNKNKNKNKTNKTTKKKRTRVSGLFSSSNATTRSCVFRRIS